MRHKTFLKRLRLIVSKLAIWLGVFHTRVAYRLRGVWRYAQDTVPIRACFLNNPKGLRTLGSVDGLSTMAGIPKKYNKISVWVTP